MGTVGATPFAPSQDGPHVSDDQIRRLKSRNQALTAELDLLRGFSRHPFDDIDLPPRVADVVTGVREESLTYLKEADLRLLAELVVEADRAGREGLVLECGTALGGSAIVMGAAKAAGRPMRVFDVFGMIPPPTEEDGADVHERYETIRRGESGGLGGQTYYGYREDLLGEVTASFARHGVPVADDDIELVRGLFEDTVHVDGPVALAHLDGDWYASTKVCLERIAPHVVPGGRIVLDDYYHWSGARTATDEYFDGRPGWRVEHRAKVHVVREG